MSERRPHILFTVLDWGLGHATRSIPLIRELLRRGARVTLAGEGSSLELLKQEFPDLESHTVNGIQVNYPHPRLLYVWMFLQAIRIQITIRKEHLAFGQLAKKIRPDAIISDNRYGAWVENIPSYLICHQLQVLLPSGISGFQSLFNRLYIRLFTPFREIWVPDLEASPGLAGILSHPPAVPKRVKYIGLLSRFKAVQTDAEHRSDEITAVVSGPEPHRSILEKKLVELLGQQTLPSLLITGKPQEDRTISKRGNLQIVSHLDSDQMTIRLMKSDVLILRPGYSTLMDLCALGRSAICIPTPGQTEQEFLAELHKSNPIKVIHQNDLQSLPLLLGNKQIGGFSFPVNTGVKSAIDRLLESIA